MCKIISVILTILGISYPFFLWFMPLKNLAVLFFAIVLFWILYASLVRGKEEILFCVLICCIFGFYFILREENLLYFYPIIINTSLLFYFFLSLKGEAIITKFARKIHKNLSDSVILYTRTLTKIWCLFFVFNICVISVLIFLENKFYWSVYCGIISYVLMVSLLVGELLFRKFFMQKRIEFENRV